MSTQSYRVMHIHFRSTKSMPALNGTGSFAPGQLVVRDINSYEVEDRGGKLEGKTVVVSEASKAKLVGYVSRKPEVLRFYFKKGNTMSFFINE